MVVTGAVTAASRARSNGAGPGRAASPGPTRSLTKPQAARRSAIAGCRSQSTAAGRVHECRLASIRQRRPGHYGHYRRAITLAVYRLMYVQLAFSALTVIAARHARHRRCPHRGIRCRWAHRGGCPARMALVYAASSVMPHGGGRGWLHRSAAALSASNQNTAESAISTSRRFAMSITPHITGRCPFRQSARLSPGHTAH